jgi:hypothetical protein
VRDFTSSLQASRRDAPRVSVASAQDNEYEGHDGYHPEQPPYSGSSTNGYHGMAEEKEVCLTEVSRGWCDFYGDFYDWK